MRPRGLGAAGMRGGAGLVGRGCAGRNMVEGAAVGAVRDVPCPVAGDPARGVVRARGTVGCMGAGTDGAVPDGMAGR